jgi:hypothetical protein
VTLKWITQRLAMGAWTHLNRRLYEQRRADVCSLLPHEFGWIVPHQIRMPWMRLAVRRRESL